MNGISRVAEAYTLTLDTSIYHIESIKKTAYKFADRTSVIIATESNSSVTLTFNFVGKHVGSDPEQVISDFCNELLDQDLREILKRETGSLRNLIVAHAFSRSSLAEKD